MNDKTKETITAILEGLSMCLDDLSMGYTIPEEAEKQKSKIDELLSELKGEKKND